MTLKKELVLGVVYSPFLNKLYTATKGNGAFLNGVPIHTKPTKTLDKALIITEFGNADDDAKKNAVSAPRAVMISFMISMISFMISMIVFRL